MLVGGTIANVNKFSGLWSHCKACTNFRGGMRTYQKWDAPLSIALVHPMKPHRAGKEPPHKHLGRGTLRPYQRLQHRSGGPHKVQKLKNVRICRPPDRGSLLATSFHAGKRRVQVVGVREGGRLEPCPGGPLGALLADGLCVDQMLSGFALGHEEGQAVVNPLGLATFREGGKGWAHGAQQTCLYCVLQLGRRGRCWKGQLLTP